GLPSTHRDSFRTVKIEETAMFRLRLATLVVAVGLGLLCGCCSLCEFPLLERLRARISPGCCADNGCVPGSEAPIADGPVLNGAVPGGPGITRIPSVTEQNALPPLAPPPRIAPQPLAQPG